MTAQDNISISEANVEAYLYQMQKEAIALEAILKGIDILAEDDRGRSAIAALIPIALDQIGKIANDCDSVNWPKALANDSEARPKD